MPVVNKVKKVNTKAKTAKKTATLKSEKNPSIPLRSAQDINAKLEFPIYDSSAKEVSKINLNPEIFGLKVNSELVAQALESQMSQARIPYAHVKGRGDVRGGGKKPWRQKGTGRARHGSSRSPIWRGGGTVFGPTKERNFAKELNKKMRRKALIMILSGKAKDNEIVILDNLKLEQPKTKLMAGLIENLKSVKNDLAKGALVVMGEKNENVVKAARNIPKFMTIGAGNLNAVDLLGHKYLIMPQEAIAVIEKTFLNK